MRNTHYTTFAASIIALVGLGWLIVALVVGGPGWDNLKVLFFIGGVVILGIAAVVYLLARRTQGAE
jgi:hypothetical protein